LYTSESLYVARDHNWRNTNIGSKGSTTLYVFFEAPPKALFTDQIVRLTE